MIDSMVGSHGSNDGSGMDGLPGVSNTVACRSAINEE
jgi:hypothetical protein